MWVKFFDSVSRPWNSGFPAQWPVFITKFDSLTEDGQFQWNSIFLLCTLSLIAQLCRLVQDLPESLCLCKDTSSVCGADNVTYDTSCLLKEAGAEFLHAGPCKSLPEIVTGPEDVSNFENERFALDCEVKGFPVPDVSWEFQAFNGFTHTLPGTDREVKLASVHFT